MMQKSLLASLDIQLSHSLPGWRENEASTAATAVKMV